MGLIYASPSRDQNCVFYWFGLLGRPNPRMLRGNGLASPPTDTKNLAFYMFLLSVVRASSHFLEFWKLLVRHSQVSFECLEDLATFPWSRGGSNLVPTPKPRILREFASQGLLGRPNPRGILKSHLNASRKWQGRVKSLVFLTFWIVLASQIRRWSKSSHFEASGTGSPKSTPPGRSWPKNGQNLVKC